MLKRKSNKKVSWQLSCIKSPSIRDSKLNQNFIKASASCLRFTLADFVIICRTTYKLSAQENLSHPAALRTVKQMMKEARRKQTWLHHCVYVHACVCASLYVSRLSPLLTSCNYTAHPPLKESNRWHQKDHKTISYLKVNTWNILTCLHITWVYVMCWSCTTCHWWLWHNNMCTPS